MRGAERSRVTLNPGLPVPSSGDVARTTASGMIANFHAARVSPSLMITGSRRQRERGGRGRWLRRAGTGPRGNALETLDATGTPISREIVYVDSEVPLYNRAYFEVRPNTPGPAYRVTVYSADWGKMGGL
jgi:hypothetical protein